MSKFNSTKSFGMKTKVNLYGSASYAQNRQYRTNQIIKSWTRDFTILTIDIRAVDKKIYKKSKIPFER